MERERNGTSKTTSFGIEDFSGISFDRLRREAELFESVCREILNKYRKSVPDTYTMEKAGHDFWMTRNRHGVGYWDRGLGECGTLLTQKAHEYEEVNLYVGDDGQIWSW